VSWVKVDDNFMYNRKVMLAGLEARMLYITSLCHSAHELTDGAIEAGLVPILGALAGVSDVDECAQKLVEVGLWEPTETGYQIHDYHDYNPPAEQVKATRKARAEAGRRGGENSHGGGRIADDAPNDYEKEQANTEAKNKQRTSKEQAKNNPVPVPDPVPDPQKEPPTEGGDPPPPPPPTETVEFDTPEARTLQTTLQATARAKGRRGPSRFETLEQKRDFLAAAQVLGDEFGPLLHKAMREGCTSRARVVAYLVGCAKNKGKARGSPVIGGEPAGFDGIRQWLEQKGAMAA
jgi:hypothetical protein